MARCGCVVSSHGDARPPAPRAFSILANSHSLLHSGQLERVRSHLEMQSRWNTWPHVPHAMDSPSSDAELGLAWYSMDGSCSELRQMAHVSVLMLLFCEG